jgi:hypothetical protein
MQSSKTRGSLTSFQPLGHPAVKLLLEVTVLLALWAGLWLMVWGGVLRPLARVTGVYSAESSAVQAEILR